jgi:hypothetical protein
VEDNEDKTCYADEAERELIDKVLEIIKVSRTF